MARAQTAHLVGVGGAGMRSLAHVLLQKGWRLSGSDEAIRCDDPLASDGVRLFAGHAAENLYDGVEVVIRSSAIPDDNPEILRAAELQIPIVSYAEMLGLLMRGRRGLAVAGTHGKSTTTAMAAEIFMAAGCDPTFIYGASPCSGGEGGHAGNGPVVLVEACEYRRNFLHLRPHDAVILNVEPDHFDCYPTRDSLEAAFCQFAALLPPEGALIVPWGIDTWWASAVARSCPTLQSKPSAYPRKPIGGPRTSKAIEADTASICFTATAISSGSN